MFNSLPSTLTAAAVDAVVLDTVLFYTELVPMSLGMPYAHVANALHFDYSGYTPFCCYDWPHETTQATLARNQKGVQRFLQTLAPTIAVGKAYAKRGGLDVDWDTPSATLSKLPGSHNVLGHLTLKVRIRHRSSTIPRLSTIL